MEEESVIQTVIIAILVIVIVFILLGFLFVRGYKAESYDDAKKQFETKHTTEATQPKLSKAEKKQKKKLRKRDGKDGTEKDKKMLELELEAQVMGKDLKGSKPEKHLEKHHSILKNKQEHSPELEDGTVTFVHTATPSDELELKHKRGKSKKQNKPKETAQKSAEKPVDTPVPDKRVVVEETLVMKEASSVSAAKAPTNEPVKKKKKSKTEQKDTSVAVAEDPEVVRIRDTSLTPTQIDSIFAVLMEKSSNKLPSLKKGDTSVSFWKQIEERDRLLNDERENRVMAESRHFALQQELDVVKSQLASLHKQNETLAAQKDSELAALQRRMQSGQQASLTEVQQLRTRLQQTQRSTDQIRQLTEENTKLTEQAGRVDGLQQQLDVLHSSLQDSVRKYNASENLKKDLEERCKQLENKLQSFQEMKSAPVVDSNVDELSKELAAAREELELTRKRHAEDERALRQELEATLQQTRDQSSKELIVKQQELEAAQLARTAVDAEVVALKEQLQDLQTRSEQQASNWANEQKLSADRLIQQESSAAEQSRDLRQRIEELQTELSTVRETAQQQAAQTNSSAQAEVQQLQTERASLEEQLQQAEDRAQQAVTDLQNRLQSQNSELQQLQQITDERNDAQLQIQSLESRLAAEQQERSVLQNQYTNLESKLSQLTSNQSSQTSEVDSLNKQISQLTSEVEQQKQKNNEQEQAAISECEKRTRESLHRLFPQVTCPETQNHEEWVTSFHDNLLTLYITREEATSQSQNDDVFEEKLRQADRQLAEEVRQKTELETKLKEKESESAGIMTHLEQHRKRSMELEEQLNESQRKLSVTQEESEANKQLLQKTEKALIVLEGHVSSEISSLTNSLTAKDKSLIEAQRRATELQNELTQKSKNSAELEQKLTEVQERLGTSEQHVTALESQLKDTQTQHTELQTQLGLVQSEKEKLQEELESMKQYQVNSSGGAGVNGNYHQEVGEASTNRSKSVSSETESETESGKPSLKGIVDDVLTS